jgi:hypothetical protein
MLTLLGTPRRCCDGMTRRQSLQAGALAVLGGLGLADVARAEGSRRAGTPAGKAKNVIVIFLLGGAASQDMYDLKPSAPADIRGEFRPVATRVPGLQVCEHLPGLARWAHRVAIVRSVNHKAGCHNPLPAYSGYDQPLPDVTSTSDSYPPSMGAVCEYLRPGDEALPGYVYLPDYPGWGEFTRHPGPYAGFLGKRYDPLFSECRPWLDKEVRLESREGFVWRGEPTIADVVPAPGITLDRLNARQTLLEQFDAQLRRAEGQPALARFDRDRQRAFSLLTAARLKTAFDLDAEDPRLRDHYGRTLVGSSTLVARRLIEAGVRFVNVTWEWYHRRGGAPNDVGWDTHWNNFATLRKVLLPTFDQVFSALMADLDARGLLDETLVLVLSDFGRTPRVNKDAGRDHWTYCYSVLLAGAGVRGGTVHGASDAQAAFVKEDPVRPADIIATVYRCLGIDPDTPLYDRGNRPHPAAQGGRAISDILA